MKPIFSYLHQYAKALNKPVFLLTSLLVAICICINYSIGIEPRLTNHFSFPQRLIGFFLLYFTIFCVSYWIHFSITKHYFPSGYQFPILLFICPLLFALKISIHSFDYAFPDHLPLQWKKYWTILIDWPLKAIVLLLVIIAFWKWFAYKNAVAGMTLKNFNPTPYFILLVLMIPLLIIAATQADFLTTYPKLKNIEFIGSYTTTAWRYYLLYELSYGTDFFSIELFFRGFLVLAFVRFAGKDAILPMAAFYCSIHFGKPLFECISSYFGGIVLGVIVYRTQTIWGGLITHVGIAWLMEVAGYLGGRFSGS